MGGSPAKLLKKIDEGKEGDAKTDKQIEKLFAAYDKDGSGNIDGDEYQKFLGDVTKYVRGELGDEYDEEAIRSWLKQWLDPNGNCKINMVELRGGICKVLDADGD
eukprot:TRINITY_DN64215_c0_g2_i1.p1 TRINITY_DN64215_c0_g2~~TRINITY_DN64215_c0_g2_i1.p1  ORF type:complete len:120 (-),score=29.12 TRINITY_DN64215_c0_g2_i1:119-433(-)